MASFIMELSGGRELVNEKRAEELISAITVTNPTHIRLSNKSFDNGAATKIAQYLEGLEGVTVANISNIIAGRPEDEALRTLNIICSSLKKFDLVEVNLSDNDLGAKGVEECKTVLLGDNIQKLYVCNNGLSAEATKLLAKILMREASVVGAIEGSDSKKTPPLELLHFYNNMAGDGGARAIANIVEACPQLVDFRFSATRSTVAGCKRVAAAIATLPNLRRLDVSDNNFKGKAGEVLVKALKNKSQLEYLNLRGDDLEGVFLFNALVVAATAGSPLKHLDLSGNNFDAEAAQQLSRALQHLPQLTALYLDDCEIGTEGARHIASAVKKLTNLRTLSLCTCEITAAGAYVLARAVAKLPQFVNLELNGNQISEAGVEAVKGVLQQVNKVLGDLEDNIEDGEDDLAMALAAFEAEGDPEINLLSFQISAASRRNSPSGVDMLQIITDAQLGTEKQVTKMAMEVDKMAAKVSELTTAVSTAQGQITGVINYTQNRDRDLEKACTEAVKRALEAAGYDKVESFTQTTFYDNDWSRLVEWDGIVTAVAGGNPIVVFVEAKQTFSEGHVNELTPRLLKTKTAVRATTATTGLALDLVGKLCNQRLLNRGRYTSYRVVAGGPGVDAEMAKLIKAAGHWTLRPSGLDFLVDFNK